MAGLSASDFKAKQARENAAMQNRVYPAGLSKCVSPLTIVCGPPAAGKTTYCKARMKTGDLLIDLDELKGGGHRLDASPESALNRRNAILRTLATRQHGHVYFIVHNPEQAEWFRQRLGGEVVAIVPPIQTTLQQCMGDPGRACKQAQMRELIREWYAAHGSRALGLTRTDVPISPIESEPNQDLNDSCKSNEMETLHNANLVSRDAP